MNWPQATEVPAGLDRVGGRVRNLVIAVVALAVTIVCWSLSSPPLSTPDENWHIANIWCARGPDESHCIEKNFATATARYNYAPPMCAHRNALQPARCATPSDTSTIGPLFSPDGNYPSTYRELMHQFIGSDGALSILRMKLFNGAVFVLILALLLYGTPPKVARSAVTALAVTLIPFSIWLITSINPSGWGISGVFGMWASVSALVHSRFGKSSEETQSRSQQAALIGVFLLSALLATQARRDVAAMAVVVVLVLIAEPSIRSWKRLFSGKPLIALATLILVSISLVIRVLENSDFSFFGFRFPTEFRSLNPSGPTFNVWFTSWVTHFPAVFLDAFGNSGLGEGHEIVVSRLVVLIGVLVVGGVLFFASTVKSSGQLASLALLVFAFACILWFASLEFDLYNVPGRYVLPLLPVIVGTYVNYSRSPVQLFDVPNIRRITIGLLGVAHALGLYAVVERYSSGFSGGIRSIPIRFDEWWWDFMPVGPNGIVILGSIGWIVFLVYSLRVTEVRAALHGSV